MKFIVKFFFHYSLKFLCIIFNPPFGLLLWRNKRIQSINQSISLSLSHSLHPAVFIPVDMMSIDPVTRSALSLVTLAFAQGLLSLRCVRRDGPGRSVLARIRVFFRARGDPPCVPYYVPTRDRCRVAPYGNSYSRTPPR